MRERRPVARTRIIRRWGRSLQVPGPPRGRPPAGRRAGRPARRTAGRSAVSSSTNVRCIQSRMQLAVAGAVLHERRGHVRQQVQVRPAVRRRDRVHLRRPPAHVAAVPHPRGERVGVADQHAVRPPGGRVLALALRPGDVRRTRRPSTRSARRGDLPLPVLAAVLGHPDGRRTPPPGRRPGSSCRSIRPRPAPPAWRSARGPAARGSPSSRAGRPGPRCRRPAPPPGPGPPGRAGSPGSAANRSP